MNVNNAKQRSSLIIANLYYMSSTALFHPFNMSQTYNSEALIV